MGTPPPGFGRARFASGLALMAASILATPAVRAQTPEEDARRYQQQRETEEQNRQIQQRWEQSQADERARTEQRRKDDEQADDSRKAAEDWQARRAQRDAPAQGTSQQQRETADLYSELKQRPPLAPANNPLLGKWRRAGAGKHSDPDDLIGLLGSLAGGPTPDMMCEMLLGDGILDFRATRLKGFDEGFGETDLAVVEYRGGGRHIAILAQPPSPFSLLEFEITDTNHANLSSMDCPMVRVTQPDKTARPAVAPAAKSVPARNAEPGPAPLLNSAATARPDRPQYIPKSADGQFILDHCDEQGGTKNCFDLAHAYAHGLGLEENIPLSMVMFQKACKLGHKEACQRVDGLTY